MNKNSILWVVLWLLTAVASGIIWFLIVKFTGYEVGYVAIGVGFSVGFILHYFMGKSLTTTIIAILFTLIWLGVAKGLIWYYIIPEQWLIFLKQENPEEAKNITVEQENEIKETMLKEYPIQQYFIDEVNVKEWGKDAMLSILFYIIALSAAYKTVNPKKEEEEENSEENK